MRDQAVGTLARSLEREEKVETMSIPLTEIFFSWIKLKLIYSYDFFCKFPNIKFVFALFPNVR